MQQYDDFVCELRIDYAMCLSDYFPVCLKLCFGSFDANDRLPKKKLLHVNNAYLKHEPFRAMIVDIIPPLISQMYVDMDIAWFRFGMRVQCVIQDYGKDYLSQLREHVNQAKDACSRLMHLANHSSLTDTQMTELFFARAMLRHNDERKLAK
ncbi:hypothetical protein GOP47_0000074 [Adiantum capillus-veneris]|uniref:Uncharacterized protein n=1 Tax=Adiantum capillus-veneris TaxID=13818 RepID=A0A9D4ZSR6_ADICA|nr:hypothetical protein GOP47_0000074 [Adiantum capillus-veneris]